MNKKPLNRKAYGHIGHLIGSRMGPGDHRCHEGQVRICTEKARDKHDRIIVQEKLDGSCCSIARVDGKIVPLVRAGYVADTSPFEQHHIFHRWVLKQESRWMKLLGDGERIVGEWLAQAHGTRYALKHEPFVAFDLMTEDKRASFDVLKERLWAAGGVDGGCVHPATLTDHGPVAVAYVDSLLQGGFHGALDPLEGAVWRVERRERIGEPYKVDFLAKYVRPSKVDGAYLPEVSGREPVWNWKEER